MITITTQPFTGKLMAAYRPIVISATVTGNPPVVYCDIYIGGNYYKSISRTQGPYDFDIQDAVQEYIQKYIPSNGGTAIETDILHEVYVKIRSSQFDVNGFIQPDGPVPVQATSGTPSTPGGGPQSNLFWGVNATLQHEDNQNLELHLNHFKSGSWAGNMFPLTHRPQGYKLCKLDSDFFPLVNKGNTVNCLKLHYKLKGQTSFQTAQYCSSSCVPISFTLNNPLPGGYFGVPYSLTIPLTGSGPFVFTPISIPNWMTGTIIGSNLVLSGTPNDNLTWDIEFEVSNCGGVSLQGFVGTLTTTALSCGLTITGVGVVVSGQPPSQPYFIYHTWWTNNGGTPFGVDLEISFDGGLTWQSPNNGNQTTNVDWFYDLGSVVEQAHMIRLTPLCGPGNPGAPTTATYTPSNVCPQPILTNVSFDVYNDIILDWINNGAWVAMTPEYSYDTVTWFGISTGSPISPRNIGNSLNNTGIVYFRLTAQCSGGPSLVSNSISFDTTIASGGNIQINNGSIPGSYISDVTPAFFVINMGSYPVLPNQTIDGIHGGYNGDITVQATGADPNDTLELFINGNFIQSVYVGAMSGLFTFVNVNINSTDNVLIRLINF